MSWVPPGGGAPVGPAPASQPAEPAADVPPAAPPATASASPSAVGSPTPAGLVRTAVLTGVVGAIVAGALIGGIGTGIAQANRPPTSPYEPWPDDPPAPSGDYSDLAVGDPGPATAVDPTVCETACFDESSAEAAILGDEVFKRWYLPTFKHVWKMTGDRTTAAERSEAAYDGWTSTGWGPDECYVTFNELPLIEGPDAVVADGLVAPLTEHSTELYSVTELTQWVRFFPDSASAEQYMSAVDAGLDVCTRYLDPNGYAIDAISREPALHQPDNVAAVGFVRSYAGIRYYVFDLQRGNMVIRSVAYSDGGISDDRFRPLMAEQAVRLGELPLVSVVE